NLPIGGGEYALPIFQIECDAGVGDVTLSGNVERQGVTRIREVYNATVNCIGSALTDEAIVILIDDLQCGNAERRSCWGRSKRVYVYKLVFIDSWHFGSSLILPGQTFLNRISSLLRCHSFAFLSRLLAPVAHAEIRMRL